MVLHNNNGFELHTANDGSYYLLWLQTLSAGSPDKFILKSKHSEKIEKSIPHYIDLVDTLALTRSRGWSTKFQINRGNEIYFTDHNSVEPKHFQHIRVKLFSPLSKNKWAKIKPHFPQCSFKEWTETGGERLEAIRSAALKARTESFQNILLEDEKIKVEIIAGLVEKARDPRIDITRLSEAHISDTTQKRF